MKRNTVVAVCQDGKWGRKVKGVVTQTKNGFRIKVRFPHPDEDVGGEVECWFRKVPAIRYKKQEGCFRYMPRPSYFAGWADIDMFCPYFSVHKWKE